MARRQSRISVPGWVRALHWLRALLHHPQAERALRQAAPELERIYLEILATEGAAASSFAQRVGTCERTGSAIATVIAPFVVLPTSSGLAERLKRMCVDRSFVHMNLNKSINSLISMCVKPVSRP